MLCDWLIGLLEAVTSLRKGLSSAWSSRWTDHTKQKPCSSVFVGISVRSRCYSPFVALVSCRDDCRLQYLGLPLFKAFHSQLMVTLDDPCSKPWRKNAHLEILGSERPNMEDWMIFQTLNLHTLHSLHNLCRYFKGHHHLLVGFPQFTQSSRSWSSWSGEAGSWYPNTCYAGKDGRWKCM